MPQYGAPGSGKTSLIQSLAGELGLDVYVLTLNRAGLDDATLSQLVAELPRRCIALIEDIDAAFHEGATRRSGAGRDTEGGSGDTRVSQGRGGSSREDTQCRVSLSGLLNALDGIGAQDGRILFATTNHYGTLDPALTRPGRMDLHIEFKLASKDQAKKLFRKFYATSEECDNAEKAVHLVDKTQAGFGEGGKPITPPPSPITSQKATAHLETSATFAVSHENLPLRQLEDAFADAIPDRRVPMACIQGFLMLHDRPCDAASSVEAWVGEQISSNAPLS